MLRLQPALQTLAQALWTGQSHRLYARTTPRPTKSHAKTIDQILLQMRYPTQTTLSAVAQGFSRDIMFGFVALSILSLAAILVATFAGAYWLVCMFGGELSAWVQSLGAILAIVTGFAAAIWQVRAQRLETQSEQHAVARAAYLLSFEALATASDRLEAALIPPNSGKVMRLQGDRTTEMVLAMREFDTLKLPAVLLPGFVRFRSHIFAVNERISEVYDTEQKNKERVKDREARLKSAVRVRTDAIHLFESMHADALKFGAKSLSISTGPNTARLAKELAS